MVVFSGRMLQADHTQSYASVGPVEPSSAIVSSVVAVRESAVGPLLPRPSAIVAAANAPSALVARKGRGERSEARPKKEPQGRDVLGFLGPS
jgi:hypothetical protein